MSDQITVRYRDGTHVTNTIRGQRASSTMSYEHAARVLLLKLFPGAELPSLRRIESVAGREVFEVRHGE